MSSGDDIETGRVTTGESTTDIVGDIPDEGNVGFNGPAVLRVGPAQGDLAPRQTLDGIHGLGTNGAVQAGSKGGTGVVGFGGPNKGSGLVGLGSAFRNGSGGTGSSGSAARETTSARWSSLGLGLLALAGPRETS